MRRDMPPVPSPQLMRSTLGRFATGVTIIACRDASGAPVGLTANSFQALSLDPPLVLWSLRLESPTLAAFGVARHFSVNVLAESQIDLSRRFASAEADKFAAGHWRDGEGGVPLLDGAAAIFECETASTQPAGDHLLIIGRVLRLTDGALPPLLFHGGRYHLLGEIL